MNRFDKKKTEQNKSPMDAALSYLDYRARTVREMERHLDELQYGEYEIQQVIQRLLELNYLNDREFAQNFVRSRLATKPVSRMHLREQLKTHELPPEVVEEALSEVDDETERQNAMAVGEKFFEQFAGLEGKARTERTMRRLLTRGFSYGCAYDVIRTLREREEE